MLRALVHPFFGPVVCLLLLVAPACAAQPPSGRALQADLRAGDAALAGGYTLSVELRVPAHPFDPAQGWELRSCTLSHGGGETAFKSTSTYLGPPRFRRLMEADYEAADFDAAGNLLLWRNRSKIGLMASEVNSSWAEVTLLRVSPGSEVVDTAPHTQLYLFPPGSADSLPEVGQILMALGRGFSSRLGGIREVRSGAAGAVELLASGDFGPSLQGEWRLRLDPGTQVVRSATFTPSGSTQPVLETWTEGSLEAGDLTVGRRGFVRHLLRAPASFYEVFVEASSLVNTADPGLLAEVRAAVIRPVPPAGEVIDFRTSPPTRRPAGY